MKTVYIKFTKKHDIGIPAGQMRAVSQKVADEFLEADGVEKATKKEYDDYKKKIVAEKAKQAKAEEKANAKFNEERKERLSSIEEEEAEQPSATMQEIDETDLELNPELAKQGFEVGDLILKNTEGLISLDSNGEFTAKKKSK